MDNLIYFEKRAPETREIGTRPLIDYFRFGIIVDFEPSISEADDKEILSLLDKSGSFSFLESPEEDIYTLEDGNPLNNE
jgi:hypothetical protein